MQKVIITLALTFLLTGCGIINSSKDSYSIKYFQSSSVTDFNQITADLLKGISPTIKRIKSQSKRIAPLYVTDFVNLNNLTNNSQLGFILSDGLKTNITQDLDWPIYQIEFSKYLKVGASGTKLLSREVSDLKYQNIDDKTYALIGTYAITQRQLLIYLKLINLKNGVILKSSTSSVTLTDEIKNLEIKPKKDITQQIFQPVVL